MANLRIEILGIPRLLRDGSPTTRLRSRQTWGVLAVLCLEAGTHHRETLAERFWSADSDTSPRQNLRVSLASIREALGKDALIEDRDTVQLAPTVAVDARLFRILRHRLRLGTGTGQRQTLLEEITGLIRGEFLSGFQDVDRQGWVETQRAIFRREMVEVLGEFARWQESAGDTVGATDTTLRLLALDPDDSTAKNIAFRLFDQQTLALLSETMDWEEAERLLAGRADRGESLSGREQQTLKHLLDRELASLSLSAQEGLMALSVFPGDFSAAQADGICRVGPRLLSGLAQRHLLVPCGERFLLREPLRALLWRRLTGEERKRLEAHHARYFLNFPHNAASSLPAGQDYWIAFSRTEAAHLQKTVDWVIAQPPTCEGCEFLEGVRLWWRLYPEGHDSLMRIIPYLEEATAVLPQKYQGFAAMLRATLAIEARRFEEAIVWTRVAFERLVESDDPHWIRQPLNGLLTAAHFGGEDAAFDEAMQMALSLPQGDYPEAQNRFFRSGLYYILAENRMARKRLEDALAANTEAIALCDVPENLPARHYQQGEILLGMALLDEAREVFDRALGGFEWLKDAMGAANCYERLGFVLASQGQMGLGRSLVCQAIERYAALGSAESRAAALGTLGDIERLRREDAEARRLYEEGLAFWKTKGHQRWIQFFENRLALLPETRTV